MSRILIADDEAYIRDLLVKYIRDGESAEEVEAAGDGREALEKARAFRPDIVVTDITMPHLSGLELIRRLQEEKIPCKAVIISGYDEFDYAKQAISLGVKDYLLKPFLPEEILRVLRKIKEELDNQKQFRKNMEFLQQKAEIGKNLAREKIIWSLLSGKSDGGNGGYWKEEGPEILPGSLCAGILKFYGTSWKFESQDRVEELLNLICGGYFGVRLNLCAVSLDETSLAVIFSIRERDANTLKHHIQIGVGRMRESFEKYYGESIRCSVGGIYDSPDKIACSYQQALNLWTCCRDQKSTVLFFGEECDKTKEDLSGQIREWKSRICADVRTAQKEQAFQDWRSLMHCYASLSSKRADYIRASAGELVYALETEMEIYSADEEEERQKRIRRAVLDHASLMELEQMLEGYIGECCDMAAKHSETNRVQQMVGQVKSLIETNLGNSELSLEWIEARIHFSASYIRQMFKQKTGESISEYMIRKRMELAGCLLGREDGKVQDAARACGYENQRYFASSFKKFYGCTPTQFKQIVARDPQLWMK